MNEQLASDLRTFCSSDCDRYQFLIDWLTREEISHSVLPTGDARHIMIRLDKIRPYLKRYYVKTLVAHYDRVPQTPGANDNSAAVMQLLYSIEKLKNLKFAHNIQIILTDKEEIRPGRSVTEQGAFQLAKLFREKKINNCLFFVFDMCGIGDTLISGQAGLQLIKTRQQQDSRYDRMVRKMEYFKTSLSDLFLSFREGEFFNLNTLFSDDLGFLLNNYPSVQLSVLPYDEAISTKRKLMAVPGEKWHQLQEKGMLSDDYRSFLDSILPFSWKSNHSREDAVDTLEERAFFLIDEFIQELAAFQLAIGEVEL